MKNSATTPPGGRLEKLKAPRMHQKKDMNKALQSGQF
jgi:hypothetical protein